MINMLKRVAAHLPASSQAALKRIHFARQIRRGDFVADEPEARLLHEMVSAGDWAIDVGANVGHYTLALARLVGPSGRVIAFEPMRSTFALLASNVEVLGANNVSLINAAATDTMSVLGMDMPKVAATGLDNPYMAQVSADGEFSVLGLRLDSLELTSKVRLVKIDAEGHEINVLRGMDHLLRTARPKLIVEGNDSEVEEFLAERGYGFRVLSGSWNRIYEYATT